MYSKYEIKITVEAEASTPAYAEERVRSTLHAAFCSPIKVIAINTKEIKPPALEVGMGSLFRKNGDLYAIVSTGIGVGQVTNRYVLTRLRDGCWSVAGTTEKIVKTMMSSSDRWILVKVGHSYEKVEWTGEVKLEEVKL